MGQKISKVSRKKSVYDPSNSSQREVMAAWYREGIDIRSVYDVFEELGHGHMGEVCIVARKETNRRQRLRQSVPPTVVTKRMSNSNEEEHSNSIDGNKSSTACKEMIDDPDSGQTPRRRLYACKTVSTTCIKSSALKELVNEVSIMRDLNHPHILQLFEIYHVKRKMWLVMELCSGGDLFQRIDTNEEADVAVIMEQICRAVAYMHSRGVCHRDIKLENILYEHKGTNADIKLIDFGLSQKFQKGIKMLKACGTIYTVAPELISSNGYTERSDIWSIGVVGFVLLSGGEVPFLEDVHELDDCEKKNRLLTARYVFGPGWKARGVSKYGREFVHKCLRRHPSVRSNANKLLDFVQKIWIPAINEDIRKLTIVPNEFLATTESATKSMPIDEVAYTGSDTVEKCSSRTLRRQSSTERIINRKNIRIETMTLEGMRHFCMYGAFKKRVLMTMAYTMDKSSLGKLSELFLTLDTEGNGTISISEFKEAVNKMHSDNSRNDLSDETIKGLFDGIDQDQSGQMHYVEFLAAVSESQGLITMERLAEAFDRIDTDSKGFISKDDLKSILGKDYQANLVDTMIEEADYKKNGQIDYDEFLRLMFEDPEHGLHCVSGGNDDWSVDTFTFSLGEVSK